MQVAHSLVALGFDTCPERESPVGFIDKRQLLAVEEIHLFLCRGAECHEDIILVVKQILVGRRHHVFAALKDDVALRKLKRRTLLLVE